MEYRDAKMHLFLSDARGIYIPRDFANSVKRECVTGISAEDYGILEEGPDSEFYWEVWEDVLNNAQVTDPSDGQVYRVYQDGDCWLVEEDAELNEDPSATGCDDMFVVEVQL